MTILYELRNNIEERIHCVPTLQLTKDNFEATIADNETVLIDFWASWCGPCRMFGPIFEKASEEHPDLVFAKVDTEAQQELATAFGISSIPTLMVFRDRTLLYSEPGALPEPVLADLIGQVRALDMDEVRRSIAAHEATHEGHGQEGHAHR
ncbi:MAG TPA: thioredoxin [Acidimicrobiia bacterium]|nr:thioredoxin [Acidimicrobiia bacterium]